MGLHRVKQFKDIELKYSADDNAGVTVKFYTDMPGGAMALRKTLTFPKTTTVQTLTLGLDNAGVFYEGTLCRFEATSAGAFRLFGGLVRLRGIGTYVDGAQGERWETQDIGIGI